MRTVSRIRRITVPSLMALLAVGAVGAPGALAASRNVALLPAVGSTPGVSIVFRSYWPLSNDDGLTT
jgi:hypothetical protein